MGSVYKDPK
jgi:hypothetical protein